MNTWIACVTLLSVAAVLCTWIGARYYATQPSGFDDSGLRAHLARIDAQTQQATQLAERALHELQEFKADAHTATLAAKTRFEVVEAVLGKQERAVVNLGEHVKSEMIKVFAESSKLSSMIGQQQGAARIRNFG